MDSEVFATLTPTERKVLRLVHHTRKSEVIASTLKMSSHTVDQHIAAARRKLGGVTRYVAADMLRDHEAAPLPLGSEALGMGQPVPPAPSMEAPDRPGGGGAVRDMRMPFVVEQSGEVDHLRLWLARQTLLPRIALILGTTMLVVILVVVAPLFTEQMGQLGRLFYGK